jgi:predicted dehydrogenase
MVNWGIIGCGNVTEVKSGPAFSKIQGSALIAVMRRNADLAADFARRHNIPRYYSRASDLINDKDVTAVYIATPPSSHMEYAIEVIRAGKPVYIEKPMALNYEQCIRINEEAEKHNVPVFVAYYRRALPGFMLVKKLIEDGAVGKVITVQLQLFKAPSQDERSGKLPWRVMPEISGGGHFFDLACHQLDYLDYIFGPVQKVQSIVLNQGGLYKAEDTITASLLFPEVSASCLWCFSASQESNRDILEITGSTGYLRFSTFSFEPILLQNGKEQQVFINERPEHVQYDLIEKIVGQLEGKGSSPSTGITAARTSRVMDEVVREYYSAKR